MQIAQGVQLVAVNVGATSDEELAEATQFWSELFGVGFERDGGPSLQVQLGGVGTGQYFNLRVRGADEPQHGHRAALGLAVEDLEDFHARALAAGATEHYPPRDSVGVPRHSRFEDPVGNRVVVWQRQTTS